MVWIGRLIGMAGLALVWATGVSAAACKPADGKLAGGYELQGVMETGSIIILLADGRFGYNFTVGAYDEIAEGCWHRDGKNVVLVPTKMEVNHGDGKFKQLVLRLSSKKGLIRFHEGKKYGEYVLVQKFKN